jgi:hypothetical protein
MTIPASWRPATGADSVPFPAMPVDLESPQADAAWARYWREREEAAARETADEAIARCRAEAGQYDDGGGARFELVLDTVVGDLDRHVADLAKPDGDKWRGLGWGECSYYGFAEMEKLARVHDAMAAAWDDLNREAFRKAAAEFARILADLALGMVPVTSTTKEGAAA